MNKYHFNFLNVFDFYIYICVRRIQSVKDLLIGLIEKNNNICYSCFPQFFSRVCFVLLMKNILHNVKHFP